MTRLSAAAVLFFAVLPVLASEPGQPLDCSDCFCLFHRVCNDMLRER